MAVSGARSGLYERPSIPNPAKGKQADVLKSYSAAIEKGRLINVVLSNYPRRYPRGDSNTRPTV
ncbi:uncharacterized protein METZ01_LOCUS220483 [marine metagenome]|uniref:Uncharacterized protein n=1 Tax=marine metagenome TaxID=408172 RepID=A0A382FYE0_9ZZZZ